MPAPSAKPRRSASISCGAVQRTSLLLGEEGPESLSHYRCWAMAKCNELYRLINGPRLAIRRLTHPARAPCRWRACRHAHCDERLFAIFVRLILEHAEKKRMSTVHHMKVGVRLLARADQFVVLGLNRPFLKPRKRLRCSVLLPLFWPKPFLLALRTSSKIIGAASSWPWVMRGEALSAGAAI